MRVSSEDTIIVRVSENSLEEWTVEQVVKFLSKTREENKSLRTRIAELELEKEAIDKKSSLQPKETS